MANKIFIIIILVLTTSCAFSPANYNDEPNSIQRADIISKNNLGITIEHSTWGKKIAFRFAA